MALIFEYGESLELSDRPSLERSLCDLWERTRQEYGEIELEESSARRRYQPFLTFDGTKCRARNYVGFIQHGDDLIEIFPKVFKQLPVASRDPDLMLRHILYWFSYCRRWRFPIDKSSLDDLEIDSLPELIINLIANRMHAAVAASPYHAYQPFQESLQTPRGTINFTRYASSSLVTGAFHKLECDHEPFLYDNKVNRIIKYCTRLLMRKTRFAENFRVLEEVTFVLNDVEDEPCTLRDLQSVTVSPFFVEYSEILDLCRIVLGQHFYSSRSYDFPHWSLLFPMEYIFEDFVVGFLEQHFSQVWTVEYQKSDKFLSDVPKAFLMQQDILLTSRLPGRRSIVIDTKYKLRDRSFKNDVKKGVSQGDMYQMLAYATKRGCREVVLLYPNTSEELHPPDIFEIGSGFASAETITVIAAEIPFWSASGYQEIAASLPDVLTEILGVWTNPAG